MIGWLAVLLFIKLAELVVIEVARKKLARKELTQKADELDKLIQEVSGMRDKYIKLLADAAGEKGVLH
ncbi:MAG: hypothetical protein HY954_07600 [Deltaproteobacteria bacterium]|nr:hypothetical protein [Deltaproteobacteria bacterium]